MKVLGNLLWLILGGFEAAMGYFSASLSLVITIVGIPWAMQTFKIGLLCLWPFGATVSLTESPTGCIRTPMNVLWFFCGGFYSFLCHIICGCLLCISIIGLPWGKQHFKMAGLALHPFGRQVTW